MTAIAVALAVGRILPDLAHSGSRWAYTMIGLGFALYGIAMIAYGTIRARTAEEAIKGSRRPLTRDPVRVSLAAAGVVLGLASAAVILFS